MNRRLRGLLSVAAMAAAVFSSPALRAAPDDKDVDNEAGAEAAANFAVARIDIDQCIFQGQQNAKGGREHINVRLRLQLAELDRTCGLSENQKKKLTLAAQGDIQQLFDQVDEMHAKYDAVKDDPQGWQQFWPEIQPLQRKVATGLFGQRSFFAKVVRKTLSSEQQEKYQSVIAQRRRFQYLASIESTVAMLENTIALGPEQHEALVKLLLEESSPPLASGSYDRQVVMYRISKLPEDKLEPLRLNPRQRKLFKQCSNQFHGMGPMLVQNGYLDSA